MTYKYNKKLSPAQNALFGQLDAMKISRNNWKQRAEEAEAVVEAFRKYAHSDYRGSNEVDAAIAEYDAAMKARET